MASLQPLRLLSRCGRFSASLLLFLGMFSAASEADTLTFSTPLYQSGILQGQDGWRHKPLVQRSVAADFRIAEGVLACSTQGLTEYFRPSSLVMVPSRAYDLTFRLRTFGDSVKLCLGPSDSLTKNHNNWTAFRARLCTDGTGGGFYAKGASFAPNSGWPQRQEGRWQYLRLRVDLSRNIYSLFHDTADSRLTEKALVLDSALAGSGPISRLLLKSDYGKGRAEVDDLVLKEAGAPPIPNPGPTWPSSAALTLSEITSTSMRLSFPPASDLDGVRWYVLYRNRIAIDTVDATLAPVQSHEVVGLLRDEEYRFKVEALDRGFRLSTGGPAAIGRTLASLPPDPFPLMLAPASDASTTPFSAFSFLVTGNNPIQSGAADSILRPELASLVHGVVVDRHKQPLSGVSISILHRPELGSTLSRGDGRFDMLVNGGGVAVFQYEKKGYLPAQRMSEAEPQASEDLDTVVLLTLDTVSTWVRSESVNPQWAEGSVTQDEAGSRQASVFFPAGTGASMVFPDGQTLPLPQMTVRATEYTVGPEGPKAMPGPLPPTSAYTYAVELSVDEAMAQGAASVRFTKALPVYVDNFLNVPTGYAVPSGYYDREKGVWIASEDGCVIQVLSPENGKARISAEVGGGESSPGKLDSMGFTDEELRQIAQRYPAGKTLWRIPITHFTPWDWNYSPPPDEPPPPPDRPDPRTECQTERAGSIIGCEDQSLGERVEIPGTGFALRYDSRNMPGYAEAGTIEFPFQPYSERGYKQVTLHIEIMGEKKGEWTFNRPFPEKFSWTWDGKVRGEKVRGRTQAMLYFRYVKNQQYLIAAYTVGNLSFGAQIIGAEGSSLSSPRDIVHMSRWPWPLEKFASENNNRIGGWEVEGVLPSEDEYALRVRENPMLEGKVLRKIKKAVSAGNFNRFKYSESGDILFSERKVMPSGPVTVLNRLRRFNQDGMPDSVPTRIAGGGTVRDFQVVDALEADISIGALGIGPYGSVFIFSNIFNKALLELQNGRLYKRKTMEEVFRAVPGLRPEDNPSVLEMEIDRFNNIYFLISFTKRNTTHSFILSSFVKLTAGGELRHIAGRADTVPDVESVWIAPEGACVDPGHWNWSRACYALWFSKGMIFWSMMQVKAT